jgi:hypothetical protein
MAQVTRTIVRSSIVSLTFAFTALSVAQVNVAGSANGGVASQSSLYSFGTSDKGNDGNRDGRWDSMSVMHTQFESGAWYKIDFATATDISQVNVFNRTDSWIERLSPFSVSLSLNGNQVWSATNQTFNQNINDGNQFASGMSFMVPSVFADSVMVKLDRTEWLHVAELEAISAVPEPGTLSVLAIGAVFLMRRRKAVIRS